jgi:hypothetical protein
MSLDFPSYLATSLTIHIITNQRINTANEKKVFGIQMEPYEPLILLLVLLKEGERNNLLFAFNNTVKKKGTIAITI